MDGLIGGDVTGFQSPAMEYAEDILSLNKHFITDLPATFYIRVKTDSRLFEFRKGDILQVLKGLTPVTGNTIVAVISGNFVLGKYEQRNGHAYVMPMNKRLGDDELNEDFIWGVAESLHRHLVMHKKKISQ